MKNLIFTICLLIFVVSMNINNAEGQWVETGPYSAEYNKSAASGNSIYLDSREFFTYYPSIIKSIDGGVVWSTIGIFQDLGCTSLKATDTYLFRGTFDGRIERTSNDGLGWEYAGEGLVHTMAPVEVIESVNGFLIASIDASGIFKSTNNGDNWFDVNNSLTITSGIKDFTTNGSYVFAADGYRNIYRSNANGENWTIVLDNPALSFNDLIYFESEIFVSTTSNGILKSTDNGNSWNFVNNGLLNLSVTSLISSGTNLYASTIGGGVFLSTNNGENWLTVNSGLQSLIFFNMFTCNAKLYAGAGDYGLFCSTNNGNDWYNVNARIQNIIPGSFISNQSFIFASSYKGIFRSSDNGNNWIFSNRGIENRNGRTLAVKDNFVFFGTQYNGVYRSSDNGNLWMQISNEFNNTKVTALASNSEYIFAGFYPERIYRSSNNGENWTPINNGFTASQVNQFISSGSDLYAGSESGVFYSSNSGNNWRNIGLSAFVSDLTYNGMYIFALMHEGIYRSSNNGTNWNLINNNQPEPNLFSLESSGSNIFAGGLDNILYSSNNGSAWIPINEGFPPQQPIAHNLFISGDYIFAEREDYPVSKRQIHEITHQPFNDVGTSLIIEPVPGSVKYTNCGTDLLINPKSRIINYGFNTQQSLFDVKIEISLNGSTVYSDFKQVTLNIGEIKTVSFTPYNIPAQDTGSYTVKSWTELPVDTNNSNDTASSTFTVINNPNFGGGLVSNMGYYFANSTEGANCAPDKPIFHWEDTTGSVNLIANGVAKIPFSEGDLDNGYFVLTNILPSGNKFQFDGICYDTFVISTNAIIALNSNHTGLLSGDAYALPTNSLPQPGIIPLCYDLDFSDPLVTGRNLKYKVTNDKLIITFDRVPNAVAADANDYVSFQIILETSSFCGSGNGIITFQYDNTKCGSTFMNRYYNNSMYVHLVGIQNRTGDKAIQYRFRDPDGEIITPGPLFGSPLAVSYGSDNSLLPVELTGFSSLVKDNNVTLNWQTNRETNNSGFNVERSTVKDQWINAGFINGNGNTSSVTEYTFTDKDLVPGKYNYRLKQIDYNGSFEYFDLTSEVIIGVPEKYELFQNYPNPFNPVTNLEFGIPELGFVTLKVYDVLGKEVKTLENEIKPAGRYRIEFDGSGFASGVYFYELRAGNFVSQKRMLLLK